MIVEFGHFAFILALFVALVQAVAGLGSSPLIAKRAGLALFGLCAIAFLSMEYAYITSDFTVINVIENSHSQKPLIYKIAGLWGNHEGSMLLWIGILAFFGAAMALTPTFTDEDLRHKSLGVQGLLAFGFIAFSLFTSNPFLRTDTPPLDGNSLNPVLQDPGLAFHPTTLYLGYVGFSSVFSIAAAALILGRVDEAWAKMVKPFVAIAWLALSGGIALGSAWAYYELGWGGFWFWDPVENASLLPWLAGTALLHSLLVLEARGSLKRWTILLSVVAFTMSLIGTFLVRSGVLSSVHAFATDPMRGTFILGLLVIYCGGAFTLYAFRAHALKTLRLFTPVSREASLVANNLLLVTMAATILTGTLYPMLMDTLGLGQISVGAPYYNATVVMMAIPLFVIMGAGPFLPWKRPGRWAFKTPLATCALITGAVTLFILGKPALQVIGFATGIWLMVASAAYAWNAPRNLKTIAITLGHFGVGLAVIGIIGTQLWKVEDIRVVSKGEAFAVGRYNLAFNGVEKITGSNYTADQASIDVNGITIHPQRRWYPVSDSDTTEAAIRLHWLDDLYVVLGESDGDKWVVRTTIHPFVSALWGGYALVVLAGMCMLLYSVRRK